MVLCGDNHGIIGDFAMAALPNVDKLDFKQLGELRALVDIRITELEAKAEADFMAEVRKLAGERGLNFDNLIKPSRKAKRKAGRTVPPKYRNPDTGDTWTGRGKSPKWLAEALENGKALEDFEIKKAA